MDQMILLHLSVPEFYNTLPRMQPLYCSRQIDKNLPKQPTYSVRPDRHTKGTVVLSQVRKRKNLSSDNPPPKQWSFTPFCKK